jgi:hypothetical protein
VIVAGEVPSSISIELGLVAASACWTAHLSVFGVIEAGSVASVTVNVDSSRRSSSAKSVGCNRHRRRFRDSTVPRLPLR